MNGEEEKEGRRKSKNYYRKAKKAILDENACHDAALHCGRRISTAMHPRRKSRAGRTDGPDGRVLLHYHSYAVVVFFFFF